MRTAPRHPAALRFLGVQARLVIARHLPRFIGGERSKLSREFDERLVYARCVLPRDSANRTGETIPTNDSLQPFESKLSIFFSFSFFLSLARFRILRVDFVVGRIM